MGKNQDLVKNQLGEGGCTIFAENSGKREPKRGGEGKRCYGGKSQEKLAAAK